jgi:HEAT repeat protein
MGLFDFFSGKGGLDRTVKAATNKNAQSADRFRALERLRDDASDEAVAGLLRRFTFNYDKSIDDEQEKNWVFDSLVEMANHKVKDSDDDQTRAVKLQQKALVLRQVEKSLLGAETIAWPLKVLDRVADRDEAWAILARVVEVNDNSYVRDPSKKIQLITFLGERFSDARASQALLQYLEDVDETVRFATVEALGHAKVEAVAREPLLRLLLSKDEESRRIKVRILDVLGEVGWNTHGFKGEVEQAITALGGGWHIDNKGRIRKTGR